MKKSNFGPVDTFIIKIQNFIWKDQIKMKCKKKNNEMDLKMSSNNPTRTKTNMYSDIGICKWKIFLKYLEQL